MNEVAMSPGNVAIITGGASGIGQAVAKLFAAKGMRIVLADVQEERFKAAEKALIAAGAPEILTHKVDVANRSEIDALREEVLKAFGCIDVLMCNAGIQPGSDIMDGAGTWQQVMDVNLGGVVNCCQSIVPMMSSNGLVINTGSKQGITTPPGDPAYNTAKAGVKVFTEALCHQLREQGSGIGVRLLIPGFVFTDINRRGRTEKPDDAWTADELAAFMLERLATDDFYILCPDNDVTRDMDEKRIAWAAGDIINSRPALSRWHKDYGAAFADYMNGDKPDIP